MSLAELGEVLTSKGLVVTFLRVGVGLAKAFVVSAVLRIRDAKLTDRLIAGLIVVVEMFACTWVQAFHTRLRTAEL